MYFVAISKLLCAIRIFCLSNADKHFKRYNQQILLPFKSLLLPSKRIPFSCSIFMIKRNLEMQSLKMKLFHHHQQQLVTTNAVKWKWIEVKNKSYKRALIAPHFVFLVLISHKKKSSRPSETSFPFTSQTIEIKLSEKCVKERENENAEDAKN